MFRVFRQLIVTVLSLACLLSGSLALAQSPFAGRWEGSYSYPPSNPQQPVSFTMELSVTGSSVRGRLTEPNTFGDRSAQFLYANLIGVVEGRRIRLIKTYDGTGGQNHSVYYEATLDPSSRTFSGTWLISDRWTGSFRADRR